MAKQQQRFMQKEFIPTFGEEFSSIAEPEFSSEIWTTAMVDDLMDKVENYGLDLTKIGSR